MSIGCSWVLKTVPHIIKHDSSLFYLHVIESLDIRHIIQQNEVYRGRYYRTVELREGFVRRRHEKNITSQTTWDSNTAVKRVCTCQCRKEKGLEIESSENHKTGAAHGRKQPRLCSAFVFKCKMSALWGESRGVRVTDVSNVASENDLALTLLQKKIYLFVDIQIWSFGSMRSFGATEISLFPDDSTASKKKHQGGSGILYLDCQSQWR